MGFSTHSKYLQKKILLLSSTTSTGNADADNICYFCQAIQAERERERHVNIQAIVEEHYERYFDQEEEYMREKQLSVLQ